jgi:hypothetical protein
MNAHQIKNAAIAEMTEMIEDAVANYNIEKAYGEEVGTLEGYIAGWLITRGYTK